MLFNQKQRAPLTVSGDLHMLAFGTIIKSGGLDLSTNPVYAMCTGPLGSAELAFPSAFRGIPASVPVNLDVEEGVKPLEKNGFSIFDITPDVIRVRMFAWRPPEPLSKLKSLEPFFTIDIPRRSS
jgi:hypothetical protein